MPDSRFKSEIVAVPKWLWTILGAATIAAAHHSVMLHVTASEVKALQDDYRSQNDVIAGLQASQQQHSALIATLGHLKNQCTTMNETLQQVRDDVIVLKTRDHHSEVSALLVE
jgi:hypothetical protein